MNYINNIMTTVYNNIQNCNPYTNSYINDDEEDIEILTERVESDNYTTKDIVELNILLKKNSEYIIIKYNDSDKSKLLKGNKHYGHTIQFIKYLFNFHRHIQNEECKCDIDTYSNILILHSTFMNCCIKLSKH